MRRLRAAYNEIRNSRLRFKFTTDIYEYTPQIAEHAHRLRRHTASLRLCIGAVIIRYILLVLCIHCTESTTRYRVMRLVLCVSDLPYDIW